MTYFIQNMSKESRRWIAIAFLIATLGFGITQKAFGDTGRINAYYNPEFGRVDVSYNIEYLGNSTEIKVKRARTFLNEYMIALPNDNLEEFEYVLEVVERPLRSLSRMEKEIVDLYDSDDGDSFILFLHVSDIINYIGLVTNEDGILKTTIFSIEENPNYGNQTNKQ